MNDPLNPSATPSPESGTSPPKPNRHPVEKLLVWGGIVSLLGITLLEAHGKFGYSGTITRLKTEFTDDENHNTKLSVVRTYFTGIPRETPIDSPSQYRRNVMLTWPSLFKDYRIELAMEREGDDPAVLGFSTPNSTEPEEIIVEGSPPARPDARKFNLSQSEQQGSRASLPDGGGGSDADGGGRGGPSSGRGRGRRLSLLSLSQRENVVAELKLTEEQSQKLKAVQEGSRGSFMQLRSVPADERPAAFKELTDKQEQSVQDALDEAQFSRLRQLFWRESGFSALVRDDVAAAVALTEEQRDKIKTLVEERRTDLLRMEGAPASEIAALRATWEEKIKEVLTDEQHNKWETVLGAPLADKPEAAAAN